ncbi:MAG: D-glycero-alpha-D-manno-heptose-1,7-bisphosphate 7-phosphatase [Kiloniellales bacterium]
MLLDRDGTVIVDRDYLADPAGVELLPGAADGLRRLKGLGLGLVIISNQSGVGRGYFGIADVERVNRRLRRLLAARGVRLDGIYYCPHAPADGCRCRKPKPGMVEQAARELGFEPESCFVIGNEPADMALGRAVGAVTVRIGDATSAPEARPDHTVADLGEAAALIEGLLGASHPIQGRHKRS